MITISENELEQLFYQAITLAHGEGEAFGSSRHKNTQCPECEKREESDNLRTYGRDRPWPKKPKYVAPPVGFGVNDRIMLAKRFTKRAIEGG